MSHLVNEHEPSCPVVVIDDDGDGCDGDCV